MKNDPLLLHDRARFRIVLRWMATVLGFSISKFYALVA